MIKMGRIKIIKPIAQTIRAVAVFIPPLSPLQPSQICSKDKKLIALSVREMLLK